MRTLRTLLIALTLLVPVAFPVSGAYASGDDVIEDCADDGVIDGRYSDRELREAERDLPSDIDEYTDCREAIRAEQGGGGGGGSAGGGPTASDPSLVTASGAVAGSRDDIAALDELTDGRSGTEERDRGEAPSIDIGGREVTPGAGGKVLGAAPASNDVPMSLLSALILLALAAVTGTVLLVRRHGLPEPVAARLGRLPKVNAPAFLRRVKLPGLFRR